MADAVSTCFGVMGFFPNGKMAFRSRNLRGVIDYGRKHNAVVVELGECISGAGLFKIVFSNGVECKGLFADPTIMLGFFINRGFVERIECERTVFNKGSALGRLNIARNAGMGLGRDGSMRVGRWMATAYRDETNTAMVTMK